MKKILFFTLFVILMSVSSAYALMVKIDPMLIDPTETNTFNIVVEDVTSLNGFQFDLYYDPDHITITNADITLDPFLGSIGRTILEMPEPYVNTSLGRIRFGAISVAPNDNLEALGPDGSGTLASINFSTNDPLAESDLYFDVNNSYIMSTTDNAAQAVQSWEEAIIAPACTVTASAGAGGTITPSGETAVKCGTTVVFTVTPDPCYNCGDVLVDGKSVGAVSSYSLPVTGTHTIHAGFALKSFTITTSAGEHGKISPSVEVNCDSSKEITITPDSGYEISTVTDNGRSVIQQVEITENGVGTYTIQNITSNHTIQAEFSELPTVCKITASAGENGKIEPSGAIELECGTSQKFTITPDSGYVADVTVNGVSKGNIASYTFENVTGSNNTIHAEFSPEPVSSCEITASAGDNGSINPSGATEVECGDSKTFTITANSGYVADVTVNGVSKGNIASYTFENVTGSNNTIHAEFSLCEIKAGAEGCGQIDPSGTVKVACGSSKTFTMTPSGCCELTDVKVGGTSVMQHVQIAENGVGAYTIPSVDKNYEIIATFAVKAYRITISPVISEKIGGKIMPSGEISAACGSSKTFTITPDDCYKIADFRVDGTSDIDQVEIDENGVGVYTIPSVDKDYDIEATFAIKNIIEATSEGRCIIEPSGKVEVGCGEDQTFKITVPEGCEISQVTVNGQSVGKVTEYTFENLTTDDNRIHAVCECDEYPINAEASGANTISPSGEVPVVRGNDITFAITSENDSFCLVVDGELAEATKQSDSEYTYTFENVQADHTIKVFDECHNITTDVAGEGIRVEPSREVIVEHGKDQTITVTAEAGTLITVMVDGELEKSGGNPEWTHTFSNVVEDHSIQVFQFFVITATGDISPSGEMTVYYGASLTFRSPEGLIVDGQPVEATDYYKFENVMEPHCIQCIDMTGAVSVLKFLAGVDMDGAVPCLDFNQDGKVDMIDALYMFRQLSAQ